MAQASTKLSRRSLIVSAAASAAAAGTSVPALAADPADAELVGIARKMLDLVSLWRSEDKILDDLEARYHSQSPPKPAELIWQVGDPVGHRRDVNDPHLWCNLDDIELLRGKEFRTYYFIGTDEEAQRYPLMYLNRAPGADIAHLYRGESDTRRQGRAAEILMAYDRWTADDDALRSAIGMDKWQDRREEMHEEMHRLIDSMIAITATTPQGWRAKAEVIREWDLCGQTDEAYSETSDLILSLVRDLTVAQAPQALSI